MLRERSLPGVLLELFLIVAGVLMALGVDGWMQDREERRLERESLSLLRADLQLLGEQLDEFTEYHDAQQASGELLFTSLRDSTRLEPTVGVARALTDMASRRTLSLPRSAYGELVTTGTLRLVKDPTLRREIVRFYETLSRDEAIIARNNQAFVDEIAAAFLVGEGMLVPVPRGDASIIGNIVGPVDQQLQEMLGELPPDQGGVWDIRPGDREWIRLQAIVTQVMRVSLTAEALAQITLERAEALDVRIQDALE